LDLGSIRQHGLANFAQILDNDFAAVLRVIRQPAAAMHCDDNAGGSSRLGKA
jgi:hypothetical protein